MMVIEIYNIAKLHTIGFYWRAKADFVSGLRNSDETLYFFSGFKVFFFRPEASQVGWMGCGWLVGEGWDVN